MGADRFTAHRSTEVYGFGVIAHDEVMILDTSSKVKEKNPTCEF